MSRLRPGLALVFGVALAAAAGTLRAAEEPRISARLVPDPIGLDEVATLELQVASSGFGGPTLHPDFDLENLEIVSGPVQAQSHSWVNGRTSSTVQLIWRLRPVRVGPARVLSLRVAIDGRETSLPDQEITVVEEAPAGRPGASGPATRDPLADPFESLFDSRRFERRRAAATQPKVMVRAEVEPTSAWVGEQISYRLVLYTQADVSSFNPLSLPDLRGFWAREVSLPDKARPEWVTLDGERFGKVVMLQRALYPLQPGQIEIAGIDVDLVIRVAEAGFFGPFATPRPQRVRTRPVTVEVRPLPAAPPEFQGVVGDLALESRIDRDATEVGSAVTLTVQLESRGNLQSLVAPTLEVPSGLRAYPPRLETRERTAGGRLLARQEWSYVVVPERPGEYELPGLEVVRFDPAAKAFRTATSPRRKLTVRAGVAEAAATPDAAAPIAGESPAIENQSPAAMPAPLWLLGAGGVVALLALGFVLGKRAAGGGQDARRRLSGALEAAALEPPRAAADGFERAWRAFLWARFGLPLEVPLAELGGRLDALGVGAEARTRLTSLLEEIDYLRHAPELSDVGHLRQEIVERSKRAAAALR